MTGVLTSVMLRGHDVMLCSQDVCEARHQNIVTSKVDHLEHRHTHTVLLPKMEYGHEVQHD